MGRKKKTTMGKQKIEMKKLEGEDARHVCFSKRKAGLFSKASELATLCAAEVAILVDSPAGSPYSFGSPAINQVADRFLHRDSGRSVAVGTTIQEARRLSVVQDLNQQCMAISNQIDAVKKRKAMLERRLNELVQANQQVWKADNLEELSLAELKEMERAFYGIKERIYFNISKHLIAGSSTSSDGNHVTMLNLFGPGTSQAGPSGNLPLFT